MQSHFSGTDVPSSLLSTVATFSALEDHPAGMAISITLSQSLSPEFEHAVLCSLYPWPRTKSKSISKPEHVTHGSPESHVAAVSKGMDSVRRAVLADQKPHAMEKGPKHREGQWAENRKRTLSVLGPDCFTLIRLVADFPKLISLLFIFGWFPLPCSLRIQIALEFIVALTKIRHSGQQTFLLQVSWKVTCYRFAQWASAAAFVIFSIHSSSDTL